ncbi:hypothetical protein GCM10022225_26500 [Plantactinospora mayteni]|uniref:Pyrrolo-quinoline quinone repeat domain-containing protein n=1 Tax=Plantactinospora mayteni TaxID=566021 RepID=A0ABQ4EIT9_9ACTN|nr:PQQ-binding-like beta-propeller repeat protein [Plantactinospora mayteni]GIG94620.1 hypothetical protein Pma05_11930 [Plantactinospora mayteni]
MTSPAAVVGDFVLFGTDDVENPGEDYELSESVVVAHDRGTGRQVWNAGAGSCPVVVDDLCLAIDAPGLRAVELSERSELWRRVDDFGVLTAPPAIYDDMVFFTEGFEAQRNNGGLNALELLDGARRWGFNQDDVDDDQWENWEPPAPFHPVVCNGLVWVSRACREYCAVIGFDTATGQERWRYQLDGAPGGSAAISNGTLFIEERNEGAGHLLAINIATREPIWRTPVPTLCGSPVLAGGLVHVAAETGKVLTLDAITGAMRWSFDSGEPINPEADDYREVDSPLTISDNSLYLRTSRAIHALG